VAAPHFRRIRSAVASGDDARLDAVVSSAIPWTLFWLETAGTGVILWLMVYKPF
jgi:hypothetical protein